MFKSKKKKRQAGEVNTGSTADIAFLLLIFFLVTTQIASEVGIPMMLPSKDSEPHMTHINERNVYNVLINSNGELMLDEQRAEMSELSQKVKQFIDNRGVEDNLSQSPNKAVVSIKADRGTTYNSYIQALDGVKQAYNELRAEHLGLSTLDFAKLDLKNPIQREKFEQAKDAYPMMISEANPSQAVK
ncbi:MAG: biopolymer transport protein ExbD [Arenicella sp.]|jgi:biopolymer transport protein ExbD